MTVKETGSLCSRFLCVFDWLIGDISSIIKRYWKIVKFMLIYQRIFIDRQGQGLGRL